MINLRHPLMLGLLAAASSASAGTPAQMSETVNATGPCSGTLPSYEAALRKRPLGILNQGSANVFVSCTLAGEPYLDYHVQVVIGNRGTHPATVSCTFIDGYQSSVENPLVAFNTKGAVIVPGVIAGMEWIAGSDSAAEHFSGPLSFSCVLPPGVELNWLYRAYGDNPF